MTSITSSNTIQYSSDSQIWSASLTPVKLKEITVSDSYTGSWRIVFDMAGDVYHSVYGQIYKNGVTYGTLQTCLCGTYNTFSQDFTSITINNNDKIQIYAYATNASFLVFIQNFRIEFDLPITFNALLIAGD